MNPRDIRIRPYRREDRAAVREICLQTADRGAPVEHLYSDREFVADLLTRYYTDFEPGYSWVGTDGDSVVGYLMGAPDTDRQQRTLALRIGPSAILRAIARGALFRAETWRMLRAARWNGRQIRRAAPALAAYPANLHIDIFDAYRARHLGARLVATFLPRLQQHGIPGVRATVRADNPGACRFFERMGFSPAVKYAMTWPVQGAVQNVETIVYARRL